MRKFNHRLFRTPVPSVLLAMVALALAYPGSAAAPAGVAPYADAVQRQAASAVSAPKVVRRFKVVVTAYNSVPEQTDSTPCITANGYDLCAADAENVVAANFLRFGTKVRLPEYSAEKIYTVQDRMHPRFARRLDLWKRSTDDAKTFGAQYLMIEVVE